MFDALSDIATNVVTSGISKLVFDEKKTESAKTEESKSENSSEFDSVLKNFLPTDSSADVSEEELFAATAADRISALKGESALEAYKTTLEAEKLALTKADGYVPVEQATINTLKKLVADGTLSSEEGDRVYTEAFNAAQLDGNTTALFDSRGGSNDPTVAIAKMSEVMLKIKSFVEKIATTPIANEELKSLASADSTGAGVSAATVGALTGQAGVSESGHVNPNGTYVDGSEGFLFKPVTNNENSLALLFAQSWTGNIASVKMLDSSNNLIENGVRKTEGIAETGREKFTFSKQGGAYPKDITVEVTFNDGSVKTYSIPDPSKRYD